MGAEQVSDETNSLASRLARLKVACNESSKPDRSGQRAPKVSTEVCVLDEEEQPLTQMISSVQVEPRTATVSRKRSSRARRTESDTVHLSLGSCLRGDSGESPEGHQGTFNQALGPLSSVITEPVSSDAFGPHQKNALVYETPAPSKGQEDAKAATMSKALASQQKQMSWGMNDNKGSHIAVADLPGQRASRRRSMEIARQQPGAKLRAIMDKAVDPVGPTPKQAPKSALKTHTRRASLMDAKAFPSGASVFGETPVKSRHERAESVMAARTRKISEEESYGEVLTTGRFTELAPAKAKIA